jgi:hypothetical protein
MLRKASLALALLSLAVGDAALAQQAMDPDNPSCPKSPNWSSYRQMRFTPEKIGGRSVLRVEGMVDEGAPQRFRAVLAKHPPKTLDEIWVRSPGGNARAGNEIGRIIREAAVPTRIPKGWACFSACNFVFMGGWARFVDEGGLFIVHMFTHTGNRDAIRAEVLRGEENVVGLIGEVEQGSALLASEDNDFLIRMGVSRKLLTEVMYRQKAVATEGGDRSTRRCLTQAELDRYTVVNAH